MTRAALALALLAGCPSDAPWATPEEAPVDTGGVPDPLADPRFRFCHGPTVPTEARSWCGLLDDAPADACPALREACAQDTFTPDVGCAGAGGWRSAGRGLGGEAEESWRLPDDAGCDAEPSEGCDPATPSAGPLGAALQWGAALLVALLVLVVLRLVLRARGRLVRTPRPAGLDAAVTELADLDALPALPEEALLERARRALEAGQLGEAVLLARGAALRRLGREGTLELHRARTDRDYVRGLRRHPETQRALREIVTAVEALRWAGRPLSPSLAEAAVRAATRLVVGALLLLIARPAHADRFGPSGDAAMQQLFAEAGWEVDLAVGRLEDLPDDVDVVVLDLIGVAPSDEDWARLEAWASAGGVLVVGGASTDWLPWFRDRRLWRADDDRVATVGFWSDAALPTPRWPDGPRWVFCDERPEPWVLPGAGQLLGAAPPPDTGADTGEPDVAPDADTPCRPSVIAARPWGQGWVIGVSDITLTWNGALIAPENRAVWTRLFPAGADRGLWALHAPPRLVLALVSLEGSDDPVDALANAHLLPFVLQLLALWALLAAWRGWPFGPRRDPPDPGRARSAEHAEALGRHWARLGASRHAAAAFARLQLRRHGADGLVTAALRHGHDPRSAAALVARAEALAHHPEGPDEASDLTLVEDLWKITRHR